MTKILPLILAASVFAFYANAFATEVSSPPGNPPSTSPVKAVPTATGSIAGSTATAPGQAPANILPVAVPVITPNAPAMGPVLIELKDGSKAEITREGTVMVINPDGTKSPAPDGILTLKNDTTFNVKDGKKVE